VRLDKWLWAARFFKTRSLAQKAVAVGRVKLNGERIKAAHEVKVGNAIAIRVGEITWEVEVKVLSDKRGPATQARKLYEETETGRAERERRIDLRRWGTEPARALKGRPTKRDRRRLEGVWSKFESLGITEKGVEDAVRWARKAR
jgi:ribosome-associated heat shock protein Hsp15